MSEAYIYDVLRTPRGRGKPGGALYGVKPVTLVIDLLKALQRRNPGLDPSRIEDVILGVVSPVGEQGGVISRAAAVASGLPDTVAGMQLDRFCASGLEAVNIAAQKVRSGWDHLIVAGGVESMSRVPMGSDGGAWVLDPETNYDTHFVPQGISADLIATLGGFTRQDCDAFALGSQERAAKAWAGGHFARSIVPVTDRNGVLLLDRDEHVRPDTTMASLGALNPAFAAIGEMGGFDAVALQKYHWLERIEHVHTPGNSSGIVDGAALVLVGSEQVGKRPGAGPSGPRRLGSRGGHRADHHAHRAGAGGAQGAGHRRAGRGGHRPVRGERGVRLGGAAVRRGARHRGGPAQRQRRGDRDGPPPRRHRRDDPGHPGRRARAPGRRTAAWSTLCIGGGMGVATIVERV